MRYPALILALVLGLSGPALAQETTTSRAGVGASDELPAGRWRLPDGIELAREITGYSVFMAEDCAPEDEAEGTGDLVRLCVSLRHTGRVNGAPYLLPITVEIPEGVMFISERDKSYQNGIVIRRIRREVRPGQTINIPVYVMCLNDTRSGSAPGVVYELGPLLRDPAFDALFARLARKKLPRETVPELQAAVWDLAAGKPISAASNAWIDALPDA